MPAVQAINDALIHMLASYERREPIRRWVPSEQEKQERPDADQER